ncbi:MAG: NADH-quinone oxidoreductase subunit N [Pirellulaceae bacterium]
MFHSIVTHLTDDTLISLYAFSVELVLVVTILTILLLRLCRWTENLDAIYVAIVGTIVALFALMPIFPLDITASPMKLVPIGELPRVEIFTGMLVYDGFSVVIKSILLLFLLLFFTLVKITGVTARADNTDFTTLVLGASLGMCVMASANHMLTVFMGIEMASVPSFVLVAFLRFRRTSSEAALKYALYGAGAAGVMLYGISLITGILNTAHLPTMAARLAEMNLAGMSSTETLVLSLAALMTLAGLAYKLSAVPFHLWAPDVFEGATAEVGAFLSVASKAAALALLVRVAVGFASLDAAATPLAVALESSNAEVAVAAEVEPLQVAMLQEEAEAAPEEAAATVDSQERTRNFLGIVLALVAAVTCTFGNLAAFTQTNIKRLLAYSTIAHAGYMMMAVPAAVAVSGSHPALAGKFVAYLALYIVVYLFMNLGAFAIVAFVRDATGSEQIQDYAGMLGRNKTVAVCFALILVSLVGLPPLAGFIGKFAVFASLAEGYQATAQTYLMVLLFIGGLNTAISLYYYLRVVKVMLIDSVGDETPPISHPIGMLQSGYMWLLTAPVVLLIVNWEFLHAWLQSAVGTLVS